MGATKEQGYTAAQQQMAVLFKALGHPARVAIIDYLLKTNHCICNDIVSELPLAQPTISQHLKELKQAGIIKGEVAGNAVCYCIDAAVVRKLTLYFQNAETQLPNTPNHCC